jgi:hypothetical protein
MDGSMSLDLIIIKRLMKDALAYRMNIIVTGHVMDMWLVI